ncbi:unnamed protein product [Camellia sinensis]
MVELDVTKKKSMAVLRVMKLGTLAIRTISKPIAARLKTDAGLHPKFRQFIINLAQVQTIVSQPWNKGAYNGYSTGLEIRPLNEGRAIEAASNMLGELFVLSVSCRTGFDMRCKETPELKLGRRNSRGKNSRNEDLTKEVGCLKLKLEEVEHLAKGRSFLDMLRSFGFPTQTQLKQH